MRDDGNTKESAEATAKATTGIFNLMRNSTSSAGLDAGGVTASSGGTGGSGHHADGTSSPGAALRDRGADHRTFYQRHAPTLLGGKEGPRRTRGGGGGGDNGPQSDAGAPGANGFGTIDAPYRAGVDAKGERGILSPRELFAYLKAHGATDNEGTMLTGAAGNESSFNPNAVHDGGNGHGLFDHNDHRIDMRAKTWQQQAELALDEVKRQYADRLNGAKTPQELADAEMHYERPRGYHSNNPRGGDNYTGRMHTIDRFSKIFGTLGQSRATAQTPIPAGTPATAVTDAEVFAARQRIQNGSRDTKDRAMVDRYLKEQNTPLAKPQPGQAPTLHHAMHAALGAIAHANRLTHHNDNRPVPVDLTEGRAGKIGKRTLGAYMDYAKKHQSEMPHAWPPWEHVSALNDVTRAARYAPHAMAHTTNHIDRSSATKIASMTVHTKATNGRELMADLDAHLARSRDATQFNSGLA